MKLLSFIVFTRLLQYDYSNLRILNFREACWTTDNFMNEKFLAQKIRN